MDVSVPVGGGGTLWVEDTGGDLAPVLLVHGDWTDSGIWAPIVPLLPEASPGAAGPAVLPRYR